MTDDNITILDAVGSATEIRTDYSTSGSAHMQVVKLALGADGIEEFVSRGQQVAGSSVPVVIPAAQLAELTTALAENKTALENLLTELQLKADLTETQPVSGSVSVTGTVTANTGLTQPLTDTQLRETAVPVSGSVVATGSVAVTSLPAVDETTGANLKASLRIYDNASEIYDEPMMVERALNVNVTNPSVTVSGAVDISATSFVHDASEAVYVGASESRVPKFAVISAASSGNNTIVGAVADKKLRVLALTLSFSGAVNAKFQSGAGGTDITGLYYGTTNTAIVLPYNKLGWFETAASALLNLNLSGAVAVGGCLTYIEV